MRVAQSLLDGRVSGHAPETGWIAVAQVPRLP